LASLLFLSVFCDGNVKDLTPENFDSIVDGSKAAFVEFFAPWCGHCKSLAPAYEVVGDAFAKIHDVVIAKVDADKHKDLGGRFGVTGFPTLKFFPKGSTTPEDYEGGRETDDIIDFINKKTGSRAKVGKAPSDVVILDSTNFDKIVLDSSKHVLVEFYAPWCGHCKKLAPIWEKLSSVFKNDNDVVIANIDADKFGDVGSKYGVSGFPTLKFFPKDTKGGVAYEGGRELSDFVKYINEKAGTKRTDSGRLDETFGRVSALDDLASAFLSSSDKNSALKKAEETLKSLSGNHGDVEFYVKYMKAIISKGNNFVETEKERLTKLMDGGSVSSQKIDELTGRKNIISQFK